MASTVKVTGKTAVVLLLAITVCCCFYSTFAMHAQRPLVGGISDDERESDEDVRILVRELKSDVEHRLGKQYDRFTPMRYKTQVVSGRNYFIKVIATRSGDGGVEHLHLRVYKPFRGGAELTSVRSDVNEHSPIEYFS